MEATPIPDATPVVTDSGIEGTPEPTATATEAAPTPIINDYSAKPTPTPPTVTQGPAFQGD
jgi:hypothetical protein